MKNFVGLIVLLFTTFQVNAMSLYEAIQANDVYVSIKKLDSQFNYIFPGKNVVISVLNKTGKPIEIDIGTGSLLKSKVNSTSDFVIIDAISKTIENNVTTEIGVYGLSLQKMLAQPAKNSSFSYGGELSEEIRQLCNYINKNGFLNSIGQDALWAINKDQPIHAIDGPNEVTIPLKHYVANLLNISYYPEPIDEQLIYVTQPKVKKRLVFEFDIQVNDEIRIEILYANGDIKETIVDRKYLHRMNHVIYYQFPIADITGEKIFIRSYINNEIVDNYIIVVEQDVNGWMAGR